MNSHSVNLHCKKFMPPPHEKFQCKFRNVNNIWKFREKRENTLKVFDVTGGTCNIILKLIY